LQVVVVVVLEEIMVLDITCKAVAVVGAVAECVQHKLVLVVVVEL
jgi:hypothetical protein